MNFYVGLHQPSDAFRFPRCMISVNRLRRLKGSINVNEWMLDSGAFTELSRHGRYRFSPADYASEVCRWMNYGRLVAAVSQDFMCEPFVLQGCNATVRQHQLRTVDRYNAIDQAIGAFVYVMPVLQGFAPEEYVEHLDDYGRLLRPHAWVGVGSVCKRQGHPEKILAVLDAISAVRPDLPLHGFGVKLTALKDARIRQRLYSADSMAWSYSARKQGRDQNSWEEAMAFVQRIRIRSERPMADELNKSALPRGSINRRKNWS